MIRRSAASRRKRLLLCAAIGALGLTATTASSAVASTVAGTATNPDFVAAAGETNTLVVVQTGTAVLFNDSNAITAFPVGCAAAGGDVTCPGVNGIDIALGDGNDSTTFTNVMLSTFQTGEAGNDALGATQDGFLGSSGGSGNDELSANPDFSDMDGGTGDDILRGNAGADSFTTMHTDLADGADQFVGAAGFERVDYDTRTGALTITLDDTANDGEAGEGDNLVGGIDQVLGGSGNDAITGRSGDESLRGNAGDDTLSGLGGQDSLDGGDGNDTLNGGDGDDQLLGEQGTDVHNGGPGIDSAEAYSFNTSTPFATLDQSVTLDGVANDGAAGEGDNFAADVENVSSFDGNDSLTGNGAFNVLRAGEGNDTIDGGTGNDLLFGDEGNDTMRARDGFADRVDCGPGADTAVVDTLDDVGGSCEAVDRADVGNANDIPEDAPPTVAFQSPAANQAISADRPLAVSLTAADDRGIAQVVLIANGAVVGSDATAPYVINYQPRGADVGRNTLVAMAVDARGQTGTATQSIRLARFTPERVTATVTPARDRSAPFRFRTRGAVLLPSTVTRAQGCGSGLVNVQVKRGRTTISSRRVTLRPDCTYQSTVTFNRSRVGRTGRLTVRVRFLGNAVLDVRSAATRRMRAG